MASSCSGPLALTALVHQLRLPGEEPAWRNTVLRTRSAPLLDGLAQLATGGRHDAAALCERVLGGGRPLQASPEAARAAASLATVWATTGESVALSAGYRLLRHVLDDVGPGSLSAAHRQVFAQAAYHVGTEEDVHLALADLDLDTDVRWALETDLLNPARTPGTAVEWRGRFTQPFLTAGLSAVTVTPGAPTPFDGLGAEPSGAGVDGPQVSVIMPAFRPDEGLETSVRSILAQTYENLEVLLVDDASGPEFAELFDRCAALDARVRLLRQPVNGGTYLARNTALSHARGEFVTVQDADDWSHPRRLADHVRLLRDDPGLGASRSDAIRATDDLVMQWVGFLPRRRNASSLMFRRSAVDRIGPFDAVRKGADSEYYDRLRHFVGPIGDTRTPLAVTRLRGGTLSRADFSFERMTPDRVLYQAAYRVWHREHLARGSLPTAVGDPARRPFAAPPSFLRGITDVPPQDVDVLLVLDGSRRMAADAALALVPQLAGARLGVLFLEDATDPRVHQPLPLRGVVTLVNEGRAALISPSEPVLARTTVVLTPNVLALPPGPLPPVATAALLAVAWPPGPRAEVTDVLSADDGARTWFGSRPTWCAWDAGAQRDWRADGWELPLLTDALGLARAG